MKDNEFNSGKTKITTSKGSWVVMSRDMPFVGGENLRVETRAAMPLRICSEKTNVCVDTY